jgi:hypothetical protein
MVFLCPTNQEKPRGTQDNVCETQGLRRGDKIPQFLFCRTELDWGIAGSTIYYDYKEHSRGI